MNEKLIIVISMSMIMMTIRYDNKVWLTMSDDKDDN